MQRSVLIVIFILLLTACSASATPTGDPNPPGGTTLPSPVTASATPAAAQTPVSLTPTPTETAKPTVTTEPTPLPAVGGTLPDPARVEWQPIVSGLMRPVAITHANDSSGRLFIVEQAGVIRILQDGQLLPAAYLDISAQVGSQGNEQGLLGLAFHPRYPENGYFYVNYTDLNGDTVISRFKVSQSDPNLVDVSSEARLLSVKQPYANHNGGAIAFGPDGYLYLGLGDGGSAGDPQNYAQSLNTLLGKILRLDVDGDQLYRAPEENLFSSAQLPEIWVYGLRNPWRFSFDRLTGDLYMGDVGQNQWEEINFIPANSPPGLNLGWKYLEGSHAYSQNPPPAGLTLVNPIFEYNHSQGCSVTGGLVYRGKLLPDWDGVYLFGDYCSGFVWGVVRSQNGDWQQDVLFENIGRISSFGEDQEGEIYLVDLSGTIFKLAARNG